MAFSRPNFRTLPLVLLLIGTSWAGTLPVPAISAGAPNLRSMTRQSGYIFAGTVTGLERVASANRVPTMRITFHVDQAIRGVRNGQSLVIQEWAGLWQSGQSYRRGQRVLVFLYRPSKLGLTSTVGGQQGRFNLDSGGMVVLQQERILTLFPDRALPSVSPRGHPISITDFERAIHQAEEE